MLDNLSGTSNLSPSEWDSLHLRIEAEDAGINFKKTNETEIKNYVARKKNANGWTDAQASQAEKDLLKAWNDAKASGNSKSLIEELDEMIKPHSEFKWNDMRTWLDPNTRNNLDLWDVRTWF